MNLYRFVFFIRDMVSEDTKEILRKQQYEVVGNHSRVKICLWTKKGIIETKNLSNIRIGQTDNISIKIDTSKLESKDWIICKAYSDYTNLVITNPIFLEKI